MKEITLNEFEKEFMQPAEDWNFDAFKIVCVKCGSSKVEYNGKIETDYGYYGDFNVVSFIVVKCHDCGNAHAMRKSEEGNSSCDCE